VYHHFLSCGIKVMARGHGDTSRPLPTEGAPRACNPCSNERKCFRKPAPDKLDKPDGVTYNDPYV